MSPHIAILGAGNGAHAFGGDLALRGYSVRLYNKFAEEIVALQARGGVTLEGRNARRLGLSGLSVSAVKAFVDSRGEH